MKIRINCDLGVDYENEADVLPFINSCSVACGGHYGNFETIDNTIRRAIQYNIKIGAHLSFPDLQGFGRRELSYPYDLLVRTLSDQLRLFLMVADYNKIEIDHVKMHGALHNLAMKNEFHANAVFEAMDSLALTCNIFGNGTFFKERAFAQNKIVVFQEAFADRQYLDEVTLVPWSEPEAYIQDPEQVWKQILGVSQRNQLTTIDGQIIHIEADTFCINSDNPQVLAILKYISSRKEEI